MFGHWFEILIVVVVGMLVFGPKRVIEMGSQLGKVVRELRESTRDINLSALLSTDEKPKQTTYSHTTPVPPASAAQPHANSPVAEETIVEGGITRSEDIAN